MIFNYTITRILFKVSKAVKDFNLKYITDLYRITETTNAYNEIVHDESVIIFET